MVVRASRFVAAGQAVALVVLLMWAGGCQSGPPVSSRRLIEHQAFIDFSGLDLPTTVSDVKTVLSIPRHWEAMDTMVTPVYTHQQWRSPSTHTGVGIVQAHLPIPISAKMVIWFAKKEYAQRAEDGKVIGEWVDSLGRSWFEAENYKYHIRGYVVAKGFNAWVVYFGYRTRYAPNLAEISLAARSLESAVPMMDDTPSQPSAETPTTQP